MDYLTPFKNTVPVGFILNLAIFSAEAFWFAKLVYWAWHP